MELIDPLLQESVDLYQLYWLVRVADKCLSWNPRSRYSMNKVTREKIIYSRLYDHIKEILTAYWLFLFMNTGGKSSIRRHQSLWSRGLFSYWIWIVISNNSIASSTLLHLRWEWLLNFITIWFSWWSMMGFFVIVLSMLWNLLHKCKDKGRQCLLTMEHCFHQELSRDNFQISTKWTMVSQWFNRNPNSSPPENGCWRFASSVCLGFKMRQMK